MPNQRKKGLKLIGAQVPEKEHELIATEAKKRGLNSADFIRQLWAEYKAANNIKTPGKRS